MPRVVKKQKEIARLFSIHDFRNYFPNVYKFVTTSLVKEIDKPGMKEIVVKGKVKSGKRRIIQMMALLDNKPSPTSVHIFVSSFYRASAADKQQIQENESYLGKENVIFTVRKNWREQLRKQLTKYINMSYIRTIVIHHDELDHASGLENLFAEIHREFYANAKIKWVRYSASPEECILSEVFRNKIDSAEACILKYDPGRNYVGAKYFCEANLVRQAEPFITVERDTQNIQLSTQGKEIIQRLRDNLTGEPWTIGKAPDGSRIPYRGNVAVIRLTGSNDREQENKTLFRLFNDKKSSIPELMGCAIYMDHSSLGKGKDNIAWDDPNYWYTKIPHDRPVLVFIEYACSRSTEWACHPWLGAYHTFRSADTPYNTKQQSQERGNLFVPYSTNENGTRHEWFNEWPRFLIYGDIAAFQLSAEIIPYSQYDAPLSARMVNTRAEWGVPIRGRFQGEILNTLHDSERIRSNDIRIRIKNAILADIDTQIVECTDLVKRQLLESQRRIIQQRSLQSGIRRARRGQNLACYRIDKMKLASQNGEGYGQGQRDNQYFNLDLSLHDFQRHSEVNNTWPAVDLQMGEYYVTYFLSENEQVVNHNASNDSIYSLRL